MAADPRPPAPPGPLLDFLAALAPRAAAEGVVFALEVPQEALAAAIAAALERNPPSERLVLSALELELGRGEARVRAKVQATFLVKLRSEASIVFSEPDLRVQGEDLVIGMNVDQPLQVRSLGMDLVLQVAAVILRGRVRPSVLLHAGSRLEIPLPGALRSADAGVRRVVESLRVKGVEILEGRVRVELVLGGQDRGSGERQARG